MFNLLGRAAYRLRWAILGGAVVFLAVAVVWGTGVFGALVDGGFDDPNAESVRAVEQLERDLGRDGADVVVLYSSQTATVDDPAYAEAVTGSLETLPDDSIAAAATFFSTGSPAFVSQDRRSTYAVVQLVGDTEAARDEAYERIEDDFAAAGLEVQVGGPVPAFSAVGGQVEADIARAETLSTPILLVLLLIVFGGLVAASLPLLIGGIAVLGAFTALRVLTEFTEVSIFALNIILLLGLGLAIDYALFVVSRFREELRAGKDVPSALARTMATAGRTVAFSGLTVAISLAGLLVFPQVFLRSMGFGGMAAVLVAMVAALTVLPALLAVLGHRVNALQVPFLRRRRDHRDSVADSGRGPWARLAAVVMRRPVAVLAAVIPILLLLGAPFLGVQFSTADASSLPAGAEPRVVAERLQSDFPADPTAGMTVALTGADPAGVSSYADAVQALPLVTSVTPTGSGGQTTRLEVGYAAEPQSDAARELLASVRDLPTPAGAQGLVTGPTGYLTDLLDSLGALLPVFLLVVVVTTFVLLFLAFGSVVLPIKAVITNVVSLTASFGALVWIFQDGNLAGVLGVDTIGSVEATQPVLMLAIAFGLSMDYEVFLLSRVREEYLRTGDTTTAVATGLQRSGGIITSAAVLLMVVIGAFATSGIVFIKMIGIGMVIAIFIDATVVRGLLVPATMRLMGSANWWAPRPLRALHNKMGLSEGERPEPVVTSSPSRAAGTAPATDALQLTVPNGRGWNQQE